MISSGYLSTDISYPLIECISLLTFCLFCCQIQSPGHFDGVKMIRGKRKGYTLKGFI